jgi:membrane-associated PAP2 superfamily phosphatase
VPQPGWPWRALVGALLLILAWDASGLDLWLAQLAGGPQGFPWRDHPLTAVWLHDRARQLGWVLLVAVTALCAWPMGTLRRLTAAERAGLAASLWLSLLLVVAIKRFSATSCPWDLAAFGGTAAHVSHWLWGVADGGTGRCFPAGHASTALAFWALPVWLATAHPQRARQWLLAVAVVGAVLGGVQQLRGAHFMSHTLWTAWLCAAVPLALRQWALNRGWVPLR